MDLAPCRADAAIEFKQLFEKFGVRILPSESGDSAIGLIRLLLNLRPRDKCGVSLVQNFGTSVADSFAPTRLLGPRRRIIWDEPVVHFEIGCRDSAKTQEFYRKLFDWKIETFGPAAMIAPEYGGVGGHISCSGTNRSTTRFFMWMWRTWLRR